MRQFAQKHFRQILGIKTNQRGCLASVRSIYSYLLAKLSIPADDGFAIVFDCYLIPARWRRHVGLRVVAAHSVRTSFPIRRANSIRLPCVYYFFLAVVVIGYETTATTRWALLFIVRAFFNDTITVAVWTGFHVEDATTPPRLYPLAFR